MDEKLLRAALNGEKVLRAAIYCRVSTDEQEDNTSLETQEDEGRRYAIERGIEVMLVLKESFTGTLYRERRLLSTMREMYRRGEINCVIIRTYDRLSRDQTHFAVLIDEMSFYKVELLCVKEQFDDSLMGKYARMMLSLFAEFERNKLVDRTMTGKRNLAALRHQIIPGSKPLYGYMWNDPRKKMKTHYVLHPQESLVVLRIYRMYDDGISVRAIVRTLEAEGVPPPRGERWAEATVRKMLHNRYYIGEAYAYRYAFSQKDRVSGKGQTMRPIEDQIRLPDGVVPAIVPIELFESCQHRIEANIADSARNNKHPLVALLRSGFAKCGYCGGNLTVMTSTKGKYSYVVYVCSKRMKAIKRTCMGPVASASTLDALVWKQMEELADDAQLIAEAIKQAVSQDRFESEAESLQNSLASWIELREQYKKDLKNPVLRGTARNVVLGELTDAEETIKRIEQEIELVRRGQVDFEAIKREYRLIQTWCETVQQEREALSYDRKRIFMRLIGIEVQVYREDDTEHKRYELQVKLPNVAPLVLPGVIDDKTRSCFTANTELFFLHAFAGVPFAINPLFRR